jgi:pyruvate/2-oxoglutarate dehydrogenase complex dihydrolipoamide dehydrogenase (E3) component
MQPPLPSLVKGAIEDEQEQAHMNNSNNTAEEDEVDVTETIRFKYLVYATGSRLPHPLIRLPKKKMEAKDWLKENQRAVREATRVLVVGGGALGIRES